jgi:hypothetical protein
MTAGTTKNLFGFPEMGRPGLGHSLLAWARCAVWCRDTGATMLAPRWLRLRVGPYLRNERDKRNYFVLFHKADYLHEPFRSWLMLTANRLYAELDLPNPGYEPARPTIVVFRNAMGNNLKKMFHFVSKDGPFLREEFLKMVRPRHLPPPTPEPFIAAHVRMGDFISANVAQLKRGSTNSRIPVEWYVDMVSRLRSQLGKKLPLLVISDGTDEALAPLLLLPNSRRTPRQESVTDMLTIAQASVLVASGSNFSHWGSFFGAVPRVCFPGQSLGRNAERIEPEVECDTGQEIPGHFISLLEQSALVRHG